MKASEDKMAKLEQG